MQNARNRSNYRSVGAAPKTPAGPGPARAGKRSAPSEGAPRREYEDFGGPGVGVGETKTRGADGSTSLARTGDVGTQLAGDTMRAILQSAYTIAKQYPRDLIVSTQRLLVRCRNPEFAAVAMYAKPQGTDPDGKQTFVFGPSIRLAEACAEALGNIYVHTAIVYDTAGTVNEAGKREIVTTAIDLETNNLQGGPLMFEKAVERRSYTKGAVPISTRRNYKGDPIYLLHATDDELRQKHFAMVSINVRNWSLRLVPREMLFEAIRVIEETEASQVKADPSAALKAMVAGFLRLGVKASQLRDYLGHDLERINTEELLLLRKLGAAIKDGHTTWREVIAAEAEARTVEEQEHAAKAAADVAAGVPRPTRGQEVAARVAARKRGVHAPRPAPRPTPSEAGPPPVGGTPDDDDDGHHEAYD